ncbi:MAG: hypothetical protein J5590_02680 [Clostridia bacterium]|nr:hypothetical protein [Clostridia bacterium]
MKKILAVFLALLFLLSFNTYADGGNIYISDIKVFIDYIWVPSYNLDGYSAVLVRDLEDYGFDIDWNGDTRTVKITHDPDKKVSPHAPQYYPPHEVGMIRFGTYPSDIKVYFEGRYVPSVNIGGRCAVKLRDINILNTLGYDDQKKEAYIFYGKAPLSGKDSEYINTFYEIMAEIVRGDYERIRIEAMLISGEYDKKLMSDVKEYTDSLKELMDKYKDYTEPAAFSESSMELWWAAVNSRYATCTMYEMGENLKNGSDNPDLFMYMQQYKEDSAYQRDNAMAILATEIKPKEPEMPIDIEDDAED